MYQIWRAFPNSWCTPSLVTRFLEQEADFERHLVLNIAIARNPASLLLDLKPHHIAQRLRCTFDGPLHAVIEPHGGGPDKFRFPENFAFLISHDRFLLFCFIWIPSSESVRSIVYFQGDSKVALWNGSRNNSLLNLSFSSSSTVTPCLRFQEHR